jgi:NADP-dependent 3-hydroxy acid dehydrogenase YdfG
MDPKPDYQPRFPGSGRLQGKVAVITGGDSGIGRATAMLFAREGANVAILYLDEGEDARLTAQLIEGEGRQCLAISGDVGDPTFCAGAVQQVMKQFGRIDILVNNAAEQHPKKDPTEITPGQLERTFRTNIFGYFFMTQAALPHLKSGASIVNVSSVTAYRGSPELLDYSSTKGRSSPSPDRWRRAWSSAASGSTASRLARSGRRSSRRPSRPTRSRVWRADADEAPRPAERGCVVPALPRLRRRFLRDRLVPASQWRRADGKLTVRTAKRPR